ncbi:MAG: hypothetical protein ABI140_19395 [Jatrophihabitantaceae bacterium]
MNHASRTARSVLAATLTASVLALAPVSPAGATAIPDPNTQYLMDSYHYGNVHGLVIGQYAHDGPCGSAFWWGDTSPYVTTTWVTCPGH